MQAWKKPSPTSTKEVQQFLGLCNYYRQYIRNFNDIASLFSNLNRNVCNELFYKLKEALISPPVLAYPCPFGTFILDTDALTTGFGGVLSQIQEGKEKIIAFASRNLT